MSEQAGMSEKEKAFKEFLIHPADMRGTTRYRKLFGEDLPLEGLVGGRVVDGPTPGTSDDRSVEIRFQLRRYGELAELFGENREALDAAIYLCEKGADPRKLCWRVRRLLELGKRFTEENVSGQNVRSIRGKIAAVEKLRTWLRGFFPQASSRLEEGIQEVLSFLQVQEARSRSRRRIGNVFIAALTDYIHQSASGWNDKQVAALLKFAAGEFSSNTGYGIGEWNAEAVRKRRRDDKGSLKRPRPRIGPIEIGWPGEKPGDIKKWTRAVIGRLRRKETRRVVKARKTRNSS